MPRPLQALMAGWCPNPARAIAANAVLYTLAVTIYQIPKGVGIATSIRVGNILGRPAASALESKDSGACVLAPSEVEEAVRDAKFNTWMGTLSAALLGVFGLLGYGTSSSNSLDLRIIGLYQTIIEVHEPTIHANSHQPTGWLSLPDSGAA